MKLELIFKLQAPGEAEAELAIMNCKGIVDIVGSDDADALFFGAVTLILSYVKTRKTCKNYYFYSSVALENNPNLDLTWASLIPIALLAGGDYDTGIKHVDIETTLAMAHCGLGDSLIKEYQV
ncbi:hypothetical protein WG66_010765 [Moniliophthora roreri]|nr:hypothetical protein WG66_010765 [Moniliophthora roreri]